MKETIHFFHTNDWHSHFENWNGFEKLFQKKKKEAEMKGEAVFLLDAGDAVDRQNIETEIDYGKNVVSRMNQMGYDAVTLGNNEGIGLSKEGLNALYEDAQFSVVISNLVDKEDNKGPNHTVPYVIKKTPKGLNLLIVGLTHPYQSTYDVMGWNPLDPYDAFEKIYDNVTKQEKIDLIIVLSHLGKEHEKELAEKFPQIHLIIGAHTHHVYPEGLKINQTLLTGGGKFGEFMGEATFVVEKTREKVDLLSQNERLYLAHELPLDENNQVHEQILQTQAIDVAKKRVVGTLTSPLTTIESEGGSFMDQTLELMLRLTDADLAFLPSGLFLRSLPEGNVSLYDLQQALPHSIRFMMGMAPAVTWEKAFQSMREQQPSLKHQHIYGMGFRGNIFGTLKSAPFDVFNENLIWSSPKPLRVVTIDHFYFVHAMKELNGIPHWLVSSRNIREEWEKEFERRKRSAK